MTVTPPAPGKLRILLAEDAIDQAHLLTSLLQRDGRYQVTLSQDGEHAAKLLRERQWDLLVTDLNLPGIDGFELARIAKAQRPPIPVLASTGYTSPHWIDQAYRAGADDVLLKPVDRDELMEKVRSLIPDPAKAKPAPSNEPEWDKPPEQEPKRAIASVLAVSGLVGDAERGCGGRLFQHRQKGEEVLIVLLKLRDPGKGDGIEAARRAAERLGVRMILAGHADRPHDARETAVLLERILQEVRPAVLYLPSRAEGDPDRREAHRLTMAAADDVPNVFTYETATNTLDFRPSRFTVVADEMAMKLEALSAFGPMASDRPDLRPSFAQATARYWGRMSGFQDTEPFEVLREGGKET